MSVRPAPFPFKSLLLFVTGAVVLRLLSIVGWVFFPGHGILPQAGRILIPLWFSGALVGVEPKGPAHVVCGPLSVKSGQP